MCAVSDRKYFVVVGIATCTLNVELLHHGWNITVGVQNIVPCLHRLPAIDTESGAMTSRT